jgi:hypothetical protein
LILLRRLPAFYLSENLENLCSARDVRKYVKITIIIVKGRGGEDKKLKNQLTNFKEQSPS